MLSEVYGGKAIKKSSVFEWHKWFKEGRKNVKDNERSGSPKSQRTIENVEKVQNLVHSGRRFSIRAMAVQLNLEKKQ
jgi:ribosomal protein S5